MAAAEARAAWQRAVNRCFVQEDAKRAPKLACCQPSNLSSQQIDTGSSNAANCPDHPSIGFTPSKTPSYSNLPPDAKWWLQMQPNYGHQRVLNYEQLETDTMKNEPQVGEMASMSEEIICSLEYEDLESFLDVKKYPEETLEEMNILDCKVDQDFLDLKNMTDYYESLEMEMVGGSVSKQKNEFSSNSDSSWIGGDKVPWWRVTDGDELASFVAQKSVYHVENCDLPPPQKMRDRREPCKQAKFDHDEILISSLDWDAYPDANSGPSSVGSRKKQWPSVQDRLSHTENVSTEPLRTNNEDTPEKVRISVSDPCKAKLLEALCHSQTRARKAEVAAKKAYDDKEHILKLFFRQASQLFAYKQWFKLLQLEILLLQTKGSAESSPPSTPTSFPDFLPWMPRKPRKPRKSWQKSASAKRRKRGSRGNDIGKYAVAFAVGFTLVGAGLILGWTVGWLLPAL